MLVLARPGLRPSGSHNRNNLQGEKVSSFENKVGITRMILGYDNPWKMSIRKIGKKHKENVEYLMLGSSTFTFWKSYKEDLGITSIVNNGFGGARLKDVIDNIQHIAIPWNPTNIIIFVGTNDIAYPKPATSNFVFEKTIELFVKLRNSIPNTHIFYMSITPTPSRWDLWGIAYNANMLIKKYIEKSNDIKYIDVSNSFLDGEGKPNIELFRKDKLHPNEIGYKILSNAIKEAIK
jgi:lysophospholipase L1-like esterase